LHGRDSFSVILKTAAPAERGVMRASGEVATDSFPKTGFFAVLNGKYATIIVAFRFLSTLIFDQFKQAAGTAEFAGGFHLQ
jgi:hypothetical protein